MTMLNDILKIEEHLKERAPQDVLDSVARISQYFREGEGAKQYFMVEEYKETLKDIERKIERGDYVWKELRNGCKYRQISL